MTEIELLSDLSSVIQSWADKYWVRDSVIVRSIGMRFDVKRFRDLYGSSFEITVVHVPARGFVDFEIDGEPKVTKRQINARQERLSDYGPQEH